MTTTRPVTSVLVALLAFGVVGTAQEATKVPTPAPRLSGGFGRPRATPPPTPSATDGGQSLADVVHAAQQPKEVAPPGGGGVTINNRSLVKNTDKGKVSTSKIAPSPSRPAPSTAAAAASPAAPPAPAAVDGSATGGTESDWKATAAKARKRVADDKAHVAELEATAKKLEADFYAWDDGQYRDRVIKPAWDRTVNELANAKVELADAQKGLDDLPELARRAGAAPGWIRE
jgi:hypothetical protein